MIELKKSDLGVKSKYVDERILSQRFPWGLSSRKINRLNNKVLDGFCGPSLTPQGISINKSAHVTLQLSIFKPFDCPVNLFV
jgi:hypothetical protein